MTRAETISLIKALVAAYPNTRIEDPAEMLNMWQMIFAEYEAESIYKAARSHMATNKWFPKPAELITAAGKAKHLYGSNTALPSSEHVSIPGCTVCPYKDDCDKASCIFVE